MKNSGGEAEGNAAHVLHLLGENAEVSRISAKPSPARKRSTRSSTRAPPCTTIG